MSDCGMYEYTEVTEVESVTGSIHLADLGVDKHHPITISSDHTMTMHTLSCGTFGLTTSVYDIVD